MAKKGIEDYIEDMEYYIENCKMSAFSTNKIVVPRDEILSMIRELHAKLPKEVEKCQEVVSKKDAIYADAKKRADQLIESARTESQNLVNENEIVQAAQLKAQEIVNEATTHASAIIRQAQEESEALSVGALNYTNSELISLSDFIAKVKEEESAHYQLLVNGLSEAINTIETNRQQIASQLESPETINPASNHVENPIPDSAHNQAEQNVEEYEEEYQEEYEEESTATRRYEEEDYEPLDEAEDYLLDD